MRVALDARLAARGLGIGHFVVRLATALVARDEVSLLWLGSPAAAPEGVQIQARVAARAYPLLDRPATARWLHRQGVSVMHFTGNTGWPRPTAVASVLTVHDLIFMRSGAGAAIRQRLGHAYERRAVPAAIRAADAVAAVSHSTATDLRSVSPRADVAVIGHGITTAPGAPPRPPGAAAGRHLVAFAGRDPRKGTEVAIAAFRLLLDEIDTLHLFASAGVPPGFDRLAADLRADGRLVVHDHLPRAALDRLMAHAAALVYPSRDEGFGLPVLEAMDLGTPVITGASPATRELGADAVIRIAADRPAESIAAAVRELVADPARRQVLVARGRQRAEGFTWDAAAAAYTALYRSVARS